MTKVTFDEDLAVASRILETVGSNGLLTMIADSIASERQRCYEIAMAMDSKRGNERGIADAIMYRAPAGVRQ